MFCMKIHQFNIVNNNNQRIPFYTQFVGQKKDINRSSMLHSIKVPFDFFQNLQSIQNIF